VHKTMVKAALAGVLFVVAIVVVCVNTRARGPKTLKTVERILMCSRPQCAAISTKQVRVNEQPPFECPKCGHKSAYLLAFTPPRFNPLEPPPEGAQPGGGGRP
jgi:hypothetical protein